MNKQLAKQGTTLNKNMTNTESLDHTEATIHVCKSNYVEAAGLTCNEIDIPMPVPIGIREGTKYFDIKLKKKLVISDGTITLLIFGTMLHRLLYLK